MKTSVKQSFISIDPKVTLSLPVSRQFKVWSDANYNAFPDLELAGETLICAWRAGDHHKPVSYSGICVSVSDDRGASWSRPVVIAESFKISEMLWNCPSLKMLPDGRVVMLVDYSESGSLSEQERPPHKIAMFVSEDQGSSWTRADDLPAMGLCPDKLLVASDGAWLVSAHQPKRMGSLVGLVSYVWRSEDRGATFQGPFACGDEAEQQLCEASIIEPVPGTLVAYMRENSFLGYPMAKSISNDGGRTWTLCQTSLVGGHRPKAGVLRNNQVLITYRFAEGGRNYPANVFAYLEDIDSALAENRLAQRGRTIPLMHDMHESPDTGYTGWVEFADGEVVMVNYIRGTSNVAYIHGWSLTFSY